MDFISLFNVPLDRMNTTNYYPIRNTEYLLKFVTFMIL
jgi:hypothetical protein